MQSYIVLDYILILPGLMVSTLPKEAASLSHIQEYEHYTHLLLLF